MHQEKSIYFPTTYQESRDYFRKNLTAVQEIWPDALLESKPVSNSEDLTIDWIKADARERREGALLLTTGLHGIEGYFGMAMLDLFQKEFLSQLNPERTGLILVHAINPWGMKHHRRVNQNNVDLNRNFLVDQKSFRKEFNPYYKELDLLLNPKTQPKNLFLESVLFYAGLISLMAKFGIRNLRGGIMLGQQSYPDGVYYCGDTHQSETKIIMEVIKKLFQEYSSLIHFDFHTGYGPRNQMSLVNSPLEMRSPDILIKSFEYPRVIAADPEDFYCMEGDMVDWIYHISKYKFPQSSYYGTAFEFGTIGESIPDEMESLWITIKENQAYHTGTHNEEVREKIMGRFIRMYNPTDQSWREKALKDCRQAIEGILKSEGVL